MQTTFKVLYWIAWSINWLLSVWCIIALLYQRWFSAAIVKILLLIVFLTILLILQILSVKHHWMIGFSLLLTIGFMTGWLVFQKPTGKRVWDPPFARMPVAHFSADGKSVTIENIRDFHYRTEDDYDVRYRTDTYRFDELETMDYSITHWNDQETFGHIMLCFGFKGGRYLVVSPEARMEIGKKYEILPGIFRNYELIFIVATEEDAIQLRTHHRRYEHEEVLLYPTNTQPEVAVFLLKDLLKRANTLIEHPEFYNGIIYNCLSTINPSTEKISYNFFTTWQAAVNGISDRYAFRTGWLRRQKVDESFMDYRNRHSVNQYVEKLKDPPNFSQLIRPDKYKR